MDLLNKKYEMDVCGEDTDVVTQLSPYAPAR